MATAQEVKPPATLVELQQRLSEIVDQPKYTNALWGAKVLSLDSGKTLFERNASKLFSPASNCKLFTVALALHRLGPDYRIKTSLYSKTKPDAEGALDGDLIVYGRGDPTINARLHHGDIFQALAPLVAALTNAHVKRVGGDLVGDTSFFHGPEFGSGWAWDDLEYYYGAEVSALTINNNSLSVTVKPGPQLGAPCRLSVSQAIPYLTFSNRTETVAKGQKRMVNFYRPLGSKVVYVTGQMPLEDPGDPEEIAVPEPAGLFLAFFKEALARHGITVQGKLRTVNWLDRLAEPMDCGQLVELGAMSSLPLSDIAREVLKPSQNLYTDLLLAHVGESLLTKARPAETTSEELGIRELGRFLTEAGVPKEEYYLEEGSGLSRDNLASPNAFVRLLRYMNSGKCARIYIEALPIAGVDGSLRYRMKDTPAAGNVHAKTGSLHWANSLSGYVTSAAGEHLVFSLMLNRYQNLSESKPSRADLDAIAILLAGFTGRSSE